MKNVKSIFTVLLAVLALNFTSCKKDARIAPAPTPVPVSTANFVELRVYFSDSLTVNPGDLTLALVEVLDGDTLKLIDSVTVSGIQFNTVAETFAPYSGATIKLPLNSAYHDYRVYLGGRPGNIKTEYTNGFGQFTVTNGVLSNFTSHPTDPLYKLDNASVGTYIVF
jgi:hypothetical protein